MAEQKLIDREVFKKNIRVVNDTDCIGAHGRLYLPVELIAKALDDTPLVEAVPVVHGRWLTDPFGFKNSMCSSCKAIGDGGSYCSHCGAKMER